MLEGALEGLLFVVGEDGLSKEELIEVLDIKEEEFDKLIEDYKKSLEQSNRGLRLINFGKYKLTTKEEHVEYYKKLTTIEDNSMLSQAALEVLAIIAYNQPITRVSVDEIRGINSSHLVRRLVSKSLIKDIGRSELPGRPKLYTVTEEFLDYFGIKDVSELPKIEIEELEKDEVNLYNSKYSEE